MARRRSRFSFANSTIRCGSLVVIPSRWPLSISACLTSDATSPSPVPAALPHASQRRAARHIGRDHCHQPRPTIAEPSCRLAERKDSRTAPALSTRDLAAVAAVIWVWEVSRRGHRCSDLDLGLLASADAQPRLAPSSSPAAGCHRSTSQPPSWLRGVCAECFELPGAVPTIVPPPPVRLVPPITTAAKTGNASGIPWQGRQSPRRSVDDRMNGSGVMLDPTINGMKVRDIERPIRSSSPVGTRRNVPT